MRFDVFAVILHIVMNITGQLFALATAVMWTTSSLASEAASKHFGAVLLNIIRMVITILFLSLVLLLFTGSPVPAHTTEGVWSNLALSSLSGYIIGDYFFMMCFILIGARWGELFMTIAPPTAALFGWFLLGEQMSAHALLGMAITLTGIGISVFSRDTDEEGHKHVKVKLPARGFIYGIIAGICQGVGLVYSKQGMLIYKESIANVHETPMPFIMPFAATMIRCIVALAGFVIMYVTFRAFKRESHTLDLVTSNKKAMSMATLSAITGPCIGVAFSLTATMYTTTGITQTIIALVPVMILWPSRFFFHSRITLLEIIGAAVSVLGVALFFF